MPRSKGLIWAHFDEGAKQNSSHYQALCRGCIEKNAATATSVLGVEKSMVAHILKCPNASDTAKKLARKIKQGAKGNDSTKKRMREEDDEEENARKKRALHTNPTETNFLRQLGIHLTDVQVEGIRAQLEKATISADLPDGWFENLEVIKLFKMINETARDVTPSKQQVNDELSDGVDSEDEETDDEDEEVDEEVKEQFASWYRNKSGIFRQALMHAMDIVHHPERINQT
ncbi:hypothetical protein MPER_04465 [Moniliophthora perniciosa FA553]|nr:hypothetical protein MPER_04465 [Moniliophthora perniciosa FA553]